MNTNIEINNYKKDTIKITSILSMLFSCLIISSIGTYFTKYILKGVDNNKELINGTLIILTIILAFIQMIIFIIVMLIFYQLLKVFIYDKNFFDRVSQKQFLNMAGYFYIISALVNLILFLFFIIYSSNKEYGIEKIFEQWTYYSGYINILANFIFLSVFAVYYILRFKSSINKIKFYIMFILPYIIFNVILINLARI